MMNEVVESVNMFINKENYEMFFCIDEIDICNANLMIFKIKQL